MNLSDKLSQKTDLMMSIERFQASFVEEKIVENELRHTLAQSPLAKVKKELIEDAVRLELLQYTKEIEEGYAILTQEYKNDKNIARPEDSEIFISQEKVEQLRESGKVMNWVKEGVPLYTLLDMSSDSIYEVYTIVLSLLDSEKIREALLVSRVLLILVPYVGDFWYLYGLCLFRNKRFEHVVHACEQALLLDQKCYDGALLLIRTLRDLGRKGEAEARLSSYIEEAQRKSDIEAIELFTHARYRV